MKRYTVVALLSLILIIVMTFPLVFNLTTCIPGFFSSDESFAVLWNAWANKFISSSKIPLKATDFIAYPFGIGSQGSNLIGYLWFSINYLLSIFTTPALTYNLQVIFNLFFSGIFTFCLVLYLTKNKLAAFFSGVIFGFCPYIFVRSWQHLGETYLWPMPLFLWFLFRLKDENKLSVKVMFVLSFIITTINFDVIYYTCIILGAFLIYILFNPRRNISYVKKVCSLIILAFIVLIPQFLPILQNLLFLKKGLPSAHNVYLRPFEDLFAQSAKPLSYFLPSVAHPIFGKFTEQFIGSSLYGISVTEHTLYLGWTALILAFVAFRRRKIGTVPFGDSPYQRESFYIGFFVFLAIVAWFFSQAPWWKIGAFKIYMPSFFIYKILPMFRAYCRFGVVVMLAMAVLAGFGLKFVLERFKTQKSKIAVTTLFCALVLFEFWNYPPFKVIDVSKVPAVYYWLKERPKDVVIAEYPLDIVGPSEIYKLYQARHEKKIINGTIPGTYAHKIAKTITKLSSTHTAGNLRWMGVKYALVHSKDYLETDLIEDKEELSRIPHNPGLKFIRHFPSQECPRPGIRCIQETGPIDVYEVIALPVKPEVKAE